VISVCARDSRLSKIQAQEVEGLLKEHYGQFSFSYMFLPSKGDKMQHVSLRSLGRCDFFTKEIDELVLKGFADVSIHSAKDLPIPLDPGLQIVAITEGKEPWDSLVLREGVSQEEVFKKELLIAVSSKRREDAVLSLIPKAKFTDIRGTVEHRLDWLFSGKVDGLVVAEAALQRLELTYLNRIKLPGDSPWGQGKLAVLSRKGDLQMEEFFSVIDSKLRENE